jgi:hypothetical protein
LLLSFLRHEPTHGNCRTAIDIGRMFTSPQGCMSTADVHTPVTLKKRFSIFITAIRATNQ